MIVSPLFAAKRITIVSRVSHILAHRASNRNARPSPGCTIQRLLPLSPALWLRNTRRVFQAERQESGGNGKGSGGWGWNKTAQGAADGPINWRRGRREAGTALSTDASLLDGT